MTDLLQALRYPWQVQGWCSQLLPLLLLTGRFIGAVWLLIAGTFTVVGNI